MKLAAFSAILFLFVASTTYAQLTFLPQIGFERSRTFVQVNDLSSFSPLGPMSDFKANLRIDYRFKKGHSPYMNIGTSPGAVAYNFSDVAAVANNFKATTNTTQLKIEGGYQYSSKPFKFKKTATKEPVKNNSRTTEFKSGCGPSSYSFNRCGKQKTTTSTAAAKQNNSMNLRLQPSLGIAYIPFTKENSFSSGPGYQYNAGNYKTALVSGMGFEFGKGKQRLFTLSMFYSKGLSKLGGQEFSSVENEKVNTAEISSRTSSWGMSVGVPFSFSKTKKIAAVPAKTSTITQERPAYKSKCGSYQGRCVRRI